MKLNIQLFASGKIYYDKSSDSSWKWFQFNVDWESTPNYDTNHSTITTKAYVKAGTGGTQGTWKGTVQVGSNSSHSISINKKVSSSWVLLATFTDVVKHNDDGTLTIPIKGNLNGPTGTSLAGQTSGGSKDATMDRIPRAPQLTLSGVSTEIDYAILNFTNSIPGSITQYQVKNISSDEVISSSSGMDVTSLNIELAPLNHSTNYSGVFAIRAYANNSWSDWLTITNSNFITKGLPTARVNAFNIGNYPTLSLSSINNISYYSVNVYDGNTKLLSTTNTTSQSIDIIDLQNKVDTILNLHTDSPVNISLRYSVTVKCMYNTYTLNDIYGDVYIPADQYNPIFNQNNISYEDTNQTSLNLTGSKYKIIKGVSNVKFTITPMSAQKGATGKSYLITSGSKQSNISYSPSNITTTLDGVDSNAFSVQAIDSRDKSTLVSKTYDAFIDYFKPSLTTANIVRNNGIDKNLKLNLSGTFCNWSGLSTSNIITNIYYSYAVEGSSSYSSLIPLSEITFSGNNTFNLVNAITLDDRFDTSMAYDIRIYIQDKINNYQLLQTSIPAGEPLIWKDKANKRIGIKKKPEDTLDINGNTVVRGNLLINDNGYNSYIKNDGSNGNDCRFITDKGVFSFNKGVYINDGGIHVTGDSGFDDIRLRNSLSLLQSLGYNHFCDNFDTALESGNYCVTHVSANSPLYGWGNLIVSKATWENFGTNNYYVQQIYICNYDENSKRVFLRSGVHNDNGYLGWTSWTEIATSTNSFYNSGEQYNLWYMSSNILHCSGIVTAGGTALQFTIPTPKSMKNISSITINSLKANVRGIKGYIHNTSYIEGGYEYVRSGITITAYKATDNMISLTITKSSAYSNVTNNTPITFSINSMTITFR